MSKRFEVGDRLEPVGFDDDWYVIVRGQKDDGTSILARAVQAREGRPIPPTAQQLVRQRDGVVTSAIDLDHDGPARVSSAAYREGYDRTFGPDRSLN